MPRGTLADAIVSASGLHGSDIAPSEKARYALTPVVRGAGEFRLCGDCQQHALVPRQPAYGDRHDHGAAWDIAALVPCVEEAGGIATSPRRAGARTSSTAAACWTSSDPALHRQLLEILNGR